MLLPVVFLRLYRHGIPEDIQANLATLCAPALVLVAYQNAFETVHHPLLLGLVLLSQVLYFIVLYHVPRILKNGFNPGFSALTFPLIVSATALKGSTSFL
ncbi:hypothetical protein JG537_04325 [Streptococcus sp. SL1232]|uniref:hypothetical protein n=1 Tax=Streptococcus vicugnae TaxID=2740579 RepID=UPI0018F2DB89|nr:hypothetical protein [Streptococcus vicugnae]MBJ7540945.1 hypothetical protein [Streptococcus vicugnae]